MQQKRGTVTDQLNNILQVIQLGRKTGHLTVERGEGPHMEEGEIVFMHGQISFARCGDLNGEPALQWLKTWESCRFVFVNTHPVNTTTPFIKTPDVDQPHPLSPSSNASIKHTTSSLQALPYKRTETDRLTAVTGPSAAIQPTAEAPRRIFSAEQGLQQLTQAHLTRQHRHIYLLVDGNRSFSELVRLMGKKPEEVHHLLLDLERIGIIQY